eukprot:scaffold177161_cov29-Tisochrysis_lutea.AAC.2
MRCRRSPWQAAAAAACAVAAASVAGIGSNLAAIAAAAAGSCSPRRVAPSEPSSTVGSHPCRPARPAATPSRQGSIVPLASRPEGPRSVRRGRRARAEGPRASRRSGRHRRTCCLPHCCDSWEDPRSGLPKAARPPSSRTCRGETRGGRSSEVEVSGRGGEGEGLSRGAPAGRRSARRRSRAALPAPQRPELFLAAAAWHAANEELVLGVGLATLARVRPRVRESHLVVVARGGVPGEGGWRASSRELRQPAVGAHTALRLRQCSTGAGNARRAR